MPDPIPTDTPARRALIELLNAVGALAPLNLARSGDEDDSAALAHWIGSTLLGRRALPIGGATVLRAASAEIRATLRDRGLLVTAQGKLVRIVDDAELERRYAIARAAGPDPDAAHDDHERSA